MKKIIIIAASLLVSSQAKASFFIDYQGLEYKPPQHSNQPVVSPNGYRLLTDELKGLVFEVGSRERVEETSSFADSVELKYAIGSIMPSKWSAYVDEKLTGLKEITFSANKEPWLQVLARVGAKFGYKFVVDWEQKVVQVSEDELFNEPDPTAPVVVESNTGTKYYIYKTKQDIGNGYMIVDGEMIPISLK